MAKIGNHIVDLVVVLWLLLSVFNARPSLCAEYILNAAAGEFSTPYHPGEYPNNRLDNWYINLQQYEKLDIISGTQNPQFESCCDFFKVLVDGMYKFELKNATLPVGSTLYSVVGPAKVTLAFNSDHSVTGSGLKGRYHITCRLTCSDGKLR
jgi:hypothetical protein